MTHRHGLRRGGRRFNPWGYVDQYEDWHGYDDFPYNDDVYTDHYEDWHGGDRLPPNGRHPCAPRPPRPGTGPNPEVIEKFVIIKGGESSLLAGDQDGGSALFHRNRKDDQSQPLDVLPVQLNNGWRVGQILDGAGEGEKLIHLWRWQEPK